MRNFIQSAQSTNDSIKELSFILYRIEAHIYRGELGSASALLATIEEKIQQLKDQLHFPLTTVLVGSQLGFFSGGGLRGRLPGAIIGGLLGWLYGQNLSTHTQQDIDIIESRIEDLHTLLAVQARRLADAN